MRAFLLFSFVAFAALALGGCPVFTRGGDGRPVADGQHEQQQP